jgi:hypothetical protein
VEVCPGQREGAGRERARIVEEVQHHLIHLLQEKSSFPASLLAVHWLQKEGLTRYVCLNFEAWRNGWDVISCLTQVIRRVVVSARVFEGLKLCEDGQLKELREC